MSEQKNTDFKPAWWLRSPHLQTLWPVFFRKRYKLELRNEVVELPDGDFIDLCWSKKFSNNMADDKTAASKAVTGKTILVLHGLEGNIDSHYINGVYHQLEHSGFQPVVMHFRGCSGRTNRLARAYHSGETGDLAFIVEHIKKVTGSLPYAAIGYSLGGNVLLKWLGETAELNGLKKAVAISVPFRLKDAALRLESGLSKVYREHLLNALRKTYIKKFNKIDSPLTVEVSQLKSFWEYDDKVTAPLHGFTGAQDYYDSCSSRQFLKNIQVPTQIIHSLDDPFMFTNTVPEAGELSDAVELLKTAHGGHVGFVSAKKIFKADYWCEQKIIEFLSA